MTKEKVKKDHPKARPIVIFLAVIAIAIAVMATVQIFVIHAPWYVVVNEAIGQSIFSAFVLLLYAPLKKRYDMKEKLSVSYRVCVSLFFVSICFLYAGYLVTTKLWCGIDGGIALFFSVLGLVWYFKVYGNEDKIGDWADRKLWEKKRKMYKEKGLTEAEILADAKSFLECYTCGDTLEGDLDQSRYFSARNVTLAEMEHSHPADSATVNALAWLTDAVHAYCLKEGK